LRTGLFAPLTPRGEHLGHAVETGIFAQHFHKAHETFHYARWKTGQTDCELDLVKLAPTLKPEQAVEIKFTDRVVHQSGTWKPWLSFCQKNQLPELLITTRTHQGSQQAEGVSVIFEPSALHAYRLGAEDFAQLE